MHFKNCSICTYRIHTCKVNLRKDLLEERLASKRTHLRHGKSFHQQSPEVDITHDFLSWSMCVRLCNCSYECEQLKNHFQSSILLLGNTKHHTSQEFSFKFQRCIPSIQISHDSPRTVQYTSRGLCTISKARLVHVWRRQNFTGILTPLQVENATEGCSGRNL